ncbi:hypothetical protein [uncultured Tissierella sp.]|uniref:hypothetical protein n=1 Tax=uncultured Tissierella sp. TaxID=448160 RepID=UPI0028038A93|nr:hypothetical protein [uncultured Tissierella sp.]MDU5080253.1 hypothetical protein [Bacillota bacterium]
MYKYWLIYTDKGEFRGFKAIGFNDIESIKWFKETFESIYNFVETIEKYPVALEKTLQQEYEEFVEILKNEGDEDIPSFEQYKKDIENHI